MCAQELLVLDCQCLHQRVVGLDKFLDSFVLELPGNVREGNAQALDGQQDWVAQARDTTHALAAAWVRVAACSAVEKPHCIHSGPGGSVRASPPGILRKDTLTAAGRALRRAFPAGVTPHSIWHLPPVCILSSPRRLAQRMGR